MQHCWGSLAQIEWVSMWQWLHQNPCRCHSYLLNTAPEVCNPRVAQGSQSALRAHHSKDCIKQLVNQF
jgi:hypothetical protein